MSTPVEITSLSSYILRSVATADALAARSPVVTRTARRAGLAISAVPVLFLAVDLTVKLLRLAPAMESTAQLGYSTSVVLPLGLLQLACLVLYLVPRTSGLGAVLWTGYLGGAVATHVRLGNPLFSHILFPVFVAALLWLGLWLRDARVRRLLPLTS
jgi:hypothetical protein